MKFYGVGRLELYGINDLYNTNNKKSINGYEVISAEDAMPVWEKLSEIAKKKSKININMKNCICQNLLIT